MLLAIHGFTEIDLSWKEVLEGLDGHVVSYLLPGHGHRPCPAGTNAEWLVEDLHRKYAESGPFDLLGYSMGGRLALQFALTYPHLVRRLILVSTRPGIRNPADRAARKRHDDGLAMMLEENGIGQFVAWWENHPALRPYRPQPRSLQEHLRARRLNQDAQGLAAALRVFGQGVTPSLWDRLAELTMPVLAIAGSADTLYVQEMTRMIEALPHGRLSVIPECGHAVHRECRESMVNIIRGFLADRSAQTTASITP